MEGADGKQIPQTVQLDNEKMTKMIPDRQTIEIIREHCRNMHWEEHYSSLTIFKQFEKVTDYIIQLIERNDDRSFQKTVQLIDDLYGHCSPAAVIVIDNVFLFRYGAFIEQSADRNELLSSLPSRLQEKVISQFNASAL